MFKKKHLVAAVTCSLSLSYPALAAEADSPEIATTLAPAVVVTGTRIEQNSFDLPMSIDSVSGETIREGQLQVNLSESAARVPGVVVNNRNNPAQDLAIQIRGFGARSAFGVRGVRLYADGIPLTMPDGQGQTGTFNLDTAKSVEFLRGPFSALYGNSSGGVVQIFTMDGPDDPTLSSGLTFGSYGTQRGSITFGNDTGNVNYIFNASTYNSDGYRDHSDSRRDTFNGKVKIDFSEDTTLTLVATALDQPDNQDPQGLTEAEVKQDRRQASPNALLFDTRVSRSHEQIGAILEHKVTSNDTLRLMTYFGQRDNEQYLSVPISAQLASARNGGGVSTIDRSFGGVDLRWNHKGELVDMPYNFTVGMNYDFMEDERKGYENFVGGAGALCGAGGRVCGAKGVLRRDETNDLFNFDQYMQGSLDLSNRWSVSAGVRHSRVRFKSEDDFVVGLNPDDSGSTTFTETTPVIGAIFKLTNTINLFANAGKSFETPTFVEIAYNPDVTQDGINMDLQPSTSNNYEIGAKAFIGDNTLVNLAFFKIDTEDEIVVATSQSGRTTYRNVPESERKGMELSIDSQLPNNFRAYLAYTLLDAEFTSPFEACQIPFVGFGGAACRFSVPGDLETINSGSKIPGTYRYTLFGEVSWKHAPTGFSTALEMRKFSETNVSFNSADGKADSYTVFSWRGGLSQKVGNWRFNEFVRVENLFDQEYVGSVRVADSNQRYYEPAPTRNWLLGLNASYQF